MLKGQARRKKEEEEGEEESEDTHSLIPLLLVNPYTYDVWA
jgi:hypothetical protein